jgi:hypothetical protein
MLWPAPAPHLCLAWVVRGRLSVPRTTPTHQEFVSLSLAPAENSSNRRAFRLEEPSVLAAHCHADCSLWSSVAVPVTVSVARATCIRIQVGYTGRVRITVVVDDGRHIGIGINTWTDVGVGLDRAVSGGVVAAAVTVGLVAAAASQEAGDDERDRES